jgi:hypothetical protein
MARPAGRAASVPRRPFTGAGGRRLGVRPGAPPWGSPFGGLGGLPRGALRHGGDPAGVPGRGPTGRARGSHPWWRWVRDGGGGRLTVGMARGVGNPIASAGRTRGAPPIHPCFSSCPASPGWARCVGSMIRVKRCTQLSANPGFRLISFPPGDHRVDRWPVSKRYATLMHRLTQLFLGDFFEDFLLRRAPAGAPPGAPRGARERPCLGLRANGFLFPSPPHGFFRPSNTPQNRRGTRRF